MIHSGAKKQAAEALIKEGAASKLVRVLAQTAARADEVPRDARLVDFCKMLGNLTTVLGNISNEQRMFLDEMRSVPGAPIRPSNLRAFSLRRGCAKHFFSLEPVGLIEDGRKERLWLIHIAGLHFTVERVYTREPPTSARLAGLDADTKILSISVDLVLVLWSKWFRCPLDPSTFHNSLNRTVLFLEGCSLTILVSEFLFKPFEKREMYL